MSEKDQEKKKYYIYVKRVPIEVDEQVFRAYYRPIWRTFFRAKRDGECLCPDGLVWLCDGVCPGCPFYNPWRTISLDEAMAKGSIDEKDLAYRNMFGELLPAPEFIALQQELTDVLYTAINQLDDKSRELCFLLMNHSLREVAAILGIPRSTLRSRWDEIKKELRLLLIDYYLD